VAMFLIGADWSSACRVQRAPSARVKWLAEYLDELFEFDRFAYVDDLGDLHERIDPAMASSSIDNFGCGYGCGIVELVKRSGISI